MYQFFTLVGMLATGFGWVIHQINGLEKRLTSLETRVSIIETILSMMGMPIKQGKAEQ